MTAEPPAADLYPHLLLLSSDTFNKRHYEAAYHLLMAALHIADDAHDSARLDEVAALALAQQDWLARHDPDHHMAPATAARKRVQSLYDTLIGQAAIMQAAVRIRHMKTDLQL